MRLTLGKAPFRLVGIGMLALFPMLAVGCGERVSEEELEAAQRDLEAARSQVQTLETQLEQSRTEVVKSLAAGIGEVLSISEIMVYEPTVVEIKHSSAAIAMVTKVNTICTVAYGLTDEYGQISTDMQMERGGHTNHYHLLADLEPDTAYHFKWGLVAPDGTVYGSKDFTFRTLPAGSGASS